MLPMRRAWPHSPILSSPQQQTWQTTGAPTKNTACQRHGSRDRVGKRAASIAGRGAAIDADGTDKYPTRPPDDQLPAAESNQLYTGPKNKLIKIPATINGH